MDTPAHDIDSMTEAGTSPSNIGGVSLSCCQKMSLCPLKNDVTLACVQLLVGPDKAQNLSRARIKVLEASRAGARIVVLPECFNSPYGTAYFRQYAETISPSPPSADQSPSFHAMASMAKEAQVYLVGGSIPELEPHPADPDQRKYYNTCLIFSPEGTLIGTHRKIHLCDVTIPGKAHLRESEVLSAGDDITIVDLPEYGELGVAICYDIRFPEVAAVAARKGCFAMVYPAAFSITTGSLHWSILAKARALDNQIYVALCSPARQSQGGHRPWGHSLIVDPLAQIVTEAGEEEDTVMAALSPTVISETRTNIPVYVHRRFDVYKDVSQ
ncbi:Hydrolase C26A3.11 [Exophiala dermatitidis]